MFDALIDRRETDSVRWDKYAGRDVIPLWVADTDFRAPPAVIDALQARVAHGVFGYTAPPAALLEAIVARLVKEINVVLRLPAIRERFAAEGVEIGGITVIRIGDVPTGEAGGKVVIAGTPEEVMDCRTSVTGKYLKGVLEKQLAVSD